ncbi:hypothetical protein CYFUS_006585 [Cystobacter fuscus]|uniref:Uncharacterized protein n=1 Tax=Cystobacter fuscus TaxID=43 RepID=A0A250JBZ4_9BACT|nr:hypothetical protein [Cystobacter fuscus]ATB41123.1 hypothetical protein CYFUS_006585 [Cystobacter fuscus]
MPCPLPSSAPLPVPTLAELLQALESVSPSEAERYRARVATLEETCAQAHAQLLQDEEALAAVAPGGLRFPYEEWILRSSAASGSRRAWRALAVDEAVLREALEFSLAMARHFAASPHAVCEACEGSGWGPRPPEGSGLERPLCGGCGGSGSTRRA